MKNNKLLTPIKGNDNIVSFKNHKLNTFFKDIPENKNNIILNSILSFYDNSNEIKKLFHFDEIIIDEYLETILKIKNNIVIDFDYFLNISGIKYYLFIKYKYSIINYIFEIFKNNKIEIKIKDNMYIINDFKVPIIIDETIGRKLGTNKENKIFINPICHKEYNVNIHETVLHELLHVYFKHLGITEELLENRIQYIEELLCEFFIFAVINSI